MTFLQKHHGQMSDSMLTAFFIILSGGLQDAYTYCCRGKVFANAQTGNIVLLSTHLFEGDWGQALRYLVPVLAFLLGIYIAECVHRHFKRMEKVHWRQLIILAEIVLLAAVGFLPETLNTTANAVVSFVCAMQVQTFRKVRGHAYASTMCIGNMRSGTEALCVYFHTHDREVLKIPEETLREINAALRQESVQYIDQSRLALHDGGTEHGARFEEMTLPWAKRALYTLSLIHI
mgnify:CR=1 FL=1